MLCGVGIAAFGTDFFMLMLCFKHALVAVFGLWRMRRSEPVPLHYGAIAPRGTPLATGIASHMSREPAGGDA
ncbi:MAG: hypothetical protein ACI8W7_003557 [Gammaproteobacteria bacterium]|jgi:hypothetical protein